MARASKRLTQDLPAAPAALGATAVAGVPVDGAYSQPQVGTREGLLRILKLRGEADVGTLAKELGVSQVAVRQHIASLQGAALVEPRTVRRPVGRPAMLYRLTPKAESAFPQSSDRVALDLLARMEKLLGPEALERLFQTRLRDLSKEYTERLAAAKTWEEKLQVLAKIRDDEGYICRVEPAAQTQTQETVGAPALRLVEHHCPIASVAKQHPQVCRFELELFKRVLGAPGLKRSEHILSGGHACAYEVPAGTPPKT